MNSSYWLPLMPMFHKMIEAYTIDPDVLKYLLLTDSVEEALAHLQQYAVAQVRIKRKKEFRRFFLLAE
jgi:predicted Rossmann-fold nucleotide-binding protein